MRWFILTVALLQGCSDVEYGGITADLVFVDAPGRKRQALRAADVPMIVDRLQISALAADGSTLTDALGEPVMTTLYGTPTGDQLQLEYGGGEWVLARVPAGPDRTIVAKAFLGDAVHPAAVGMVGYAGKIEGIDIAAGETKNAGRIDLLSTGIKIPEVDMTPPAPPTPVSAAAIPEGEGLRITFGQPTGDPAGYVLAVTSSLTVVPELMRQAVYTAGATIADGVVVTTVWPFSGPEIIDVVGLVDDEAYSVLVYAYDEDLDGNPINYSPASTAFGVPRDTLQPAAVAGLTVSPMGIDAATISFIEPGEDLGVDNQNPVTRYDVRASTNRGDLTNPDTFASLPLVPAPTPMMVGASLSFDRTFAELGVNAGDAFFVGVRSQDLATNASEIVIAEFAVNATLTPVIDAILPQVALVGRDITVTGNSFGAIPGTLVLTTTGTSTEVFMLQPTRWEDDIVVAALPPTARSGTLELTPSGNSNTASVFVPVILRIDGAIQDYEGPFEIVSATDGRSVISALYREDNEFSPYELSVERFFSVVPEFIAYVPLNNNVHSTAAAGTYSAVHDRFLFTASNAANSMVSFLVTSSSVTPDPRRLDPGVAAGSVDSVSTVFLTGGVGPMPALVAFTVAGDIRTATVTDALTQPFNAFFVTTSTTYDYDQVTVSQDAARNILMGYRATTGTVSTLGLSLNQSNGQPSGFVELPNANAPRIDTNLEIIVAPESPGGPEVFVVAYEAAVPGGATDVRLLRSGSYGLQPGYAPFPSPEPGTSRRLEDLGVVIREGAVWLAVLASDLSNGSAQLYYTEVPMAALTGGIPEGRYRGVNLDFAPDETRGRLGCKPAAYVNCPVVWSGDDAAAYFLRR